MTEQVETSQTEETPAEPTFPDEMAKMSFLTLNDLIDKRNANVGKINAVKGDRQTLMEQMEEKSDSEAAVAARKKRDEAQAIVDEAVMELHAAIVPEVNALLEDAEASSAKIEEEIKQADSTIKPGVAYFKKMYGENLAKHLKPLARLKGFSTKGAGASGRRVRGYHVDATIDGETVHFDNLATAAKFLDVETTALQNAFFEAAGNPEQLKDAPDRVDFSVSYTEVYEDDSTEDKTAHLVASRPTKDEASDDADESEDESTEE